MSHREIRIHRRRVLETKSKTSLPWLLVLSALACSSNRSDVGERTPATPTVKTVVGEPDQVSATGLHTDESKLRGALSSDGLLLTIPLSAESGKLSGELSVQLQELTSGNSVARIQVPYSVTAGTPIDALALLPLPAGITAQSDLVQYVVRIDERSQALSVKHSLLYAPQPYEVRLEGPATPRRAKKSVYRLSTRDPVTRQGLPNMPVLLTLAQDGQAPITYSGTSNELGVFEQELTPAAVGLVSVTASTKQGALVATATETVKVQEPGSKLMLTTDKPIYQPGQVIHLRGLALASGNVPVTGADAVIAVADAKGNKLFKKSVLTDSFGIVATDFRLGEVLNQGTFKVSCTLLGQTTERTVEVSRYTLPKFEIELGTNLPWYSPGATVSATVDSKYFFGKVVAQAEVGVEVSTLDVGQTVLGRIVGKTDASGHFAFSYDLPKSLVGLPLEQGNALVNMHVSVTDTAGQQVQRDLPITVASQPISVVLVPESGELVPGVENRLLVFVTDPQGNAVDGAAVSTTLDGSQVFSATTDAYGQAVLTWVPGAEAPNSVAVQVTASNGIQTTKQAALQLQTGAENLLVRTDKAVYQAGDVVKVDVNSTAHSSNVYVDWLNDGQAVDMRTLTTSNGSASFTMPVDASLLGTNRIQAYVVDAAGNVVRAGRTVFARDASALTVSMTSDASSYLPGGLAHLSFDVKNEDGRPAVAAIGLQVVDEAVYSLIDAKPGLLETFFELEDAYSKPTYEIDAPPGNLTALLFHDTTVADLVAANAAQDRAQAALSAMGSSSVTGIWKASWPGTISEARSKVRPYFDALLVQLRTAVATSAAAELAALKAKGCGISNTYSACPGTSKTLSQLLAERTVASTMAYDAWGNLLKTQANPSWTTLMTLTSLGPDELPSTGDDVTLTILYSDVGLGNLNTLMVPEVAVLAGATVDPPPGNTMDPPAGSTTDPSSTSGPRVRKDFPETLYVNPAVITDSSGKAKLDLPLADSITDWRVSMLANSQSGRLGSATASIRVFQDFFVDVDFPATLTRGDRVDFPIVVYNYLETPQSVQVALEPASWFAALGQTTISVELQPREVKGLRFPVQVNQVGLGTLTVRANGTKASDAAARTVRVLSDGKAYVSAQSGSLGSGGITRTVAIPNNAIPGSQQLYLQVFPTFTSQVLQGLDSLLRVPSGCFEQTTSTTWPNVLLTRYMKATAQLTPEIQLKAESLMSSGYQRLLTFEHPGGGFSWFGTQDPVPYLSVTAFGVMEFADMAALQTVDEAMLARTVSWLASQQGADGSWTGDRSEFFSFQTSKVRNTAFTLWALASANYSGSATSRAVAYITAHLADETPDAYTLALIANAFALVAPSDPLLTDVLSRLDATKKVNGEQVSWDTNGTQTNFYGSGTDGAVATTALVASALIQMNGDPKSIEGALNFLAASKDTLGNFGSTQATVWTLRTMLLAATKGTKGAVGTLDVLIDGQAFKSLALTQANSDVMTTIDLASLATLGSHSIGLNFAGEGKVGFGLVAGFNVPWVDAPADAPAPIGISVAYDKTSLQLNDIVTASVNLSNLTTMAQSMVLVTLGIPPGFQILTEDLDVLVKNKTISRYDVTGKQLVLYVSALPTGTAQLLKYRLQATMPVKASDGGGEAHLYYEPTKRSDAAATVLEVTGN